MHCYRQRFKDSTPGGAPYRREMLRKKTGRVHILTLIGQRARGIGALYNLIIEFQGQIPQLDRDRRLFVW